jgi:hypothetical protein
MAAASRYGSKVKYAIDSARQRTTKVKRSITLSVLIAVAIAGNGYARGFGGGLTSAPIGNGIMGTGALWTDSIEGAGGLWGNGIYGTGGLPDYVAVPGMGDAYGGFFSGPAEDNLASKAPAHYNPLGSEQAISVPHQQSEQQRERSFDSSLAGTGIGTGGFRSGQFGPSPAASMPSDLGLHQAGTQRTAQSRRPPGLPPDSDGARYWSMADLRVLGNSTRLHFNNYNIFTREWFSQYPNAWYARGYARTPWTPAGWEDINAWFGGQWQPYDYTYGNELTYENNDVCVDGHPIATAGKYYESALAIAQSGERANISRESVPASWLPIGVFNVIPAGVKSSPMLIQLAVNKDGIIRGNYFDPPAGNLQLVQGAIDQETERATWVVADRKNIVFDLLAINLTKNETPILVHVGKDKPQQWVLVRLIQPKAQANQ